MEENGVITPALTVKRSMAPLKRLNILKTASLTTAAFHTGQGVAFSLTGEDLNSYTMPESLNLTLQQGKDFIPGGVIGNKLDNTTYNRQISMTHNGSFGVPVNMHFALGAEQAGRYANLYYYDKQKKTMEYQGSFRVTEIGSAMFGLTKACDYLLTVTKQQLSPSLTYISNQDLNFL